uniref:Putative terpene synthase 21 n=1 Tax=Eremophila drummondii TaxID=2652523 RepID=A0A6G9KU77_9LAMI|nr:putative terpene synthase 21 [Eremophila drummondii]
MRSKASVFYGHSAYKNPPLCLQAINTTRFLTSKTKLSKRKSKRKEIHPRNIIVDMEIQSSACPIFTENMNVEDVRRSVTYHPSIWGDYFLEFASKEISESEKAELLRQKEEVRRLLTTTSDNSLLKLELINAIQRLGVCYHFEKEIEVSLQRIHEGRNYMECNKNDEGNVDDELHVVALRFRLLRQQGYNLSTDVFKKFMDREGKFKESLVGDAQGMLSLYEAAHLGIRGETILDEALEFCSSRLESMAVDKMNKSLATQVYEAMKNPIRKTLTRLGAVKFLSVYQEDESHDETLLKFARLDFNLLQKLHQKELSDITRWWKGLDFKNKLPFARDRLVECYFWILGIYFEPQYQLARKILSKVILLASIIDDIYDVYGTLDELQLFTDAIQRWDICAMEQLPSYMKTCYKALFDVYAEMEESEEEGESYRQYHAREEMKKLVSAYYKEAEWLYNKHTPTMEEYMKVAIPSAGYVMIAATSLVGMGHVVTRDDFHWVSSEPLAVTASSVIGRLMDDMAGYGFEKKFSAVECYMIENSASTEEAFGVLQKQVSNAWKDINHECLHPTVVSMPILLRVLNAARVIPLLYKDGDGYSNPKTEIKEIIKSVLIEPVLAI